MSGSSDGGTFTNPGDPLRRNWLWFSLQQLLQILFVFVFRYRARGYEKLPPGGALLLINHQSMLDPLLVGLPLKRPVSYVARENLFHVPIVGWILKRTYVMPINRESAGTQIIRESTKRMKQGFLVGLFPEGTRTNDGNLGPLKPGFVALVRRAGVPVFPVGIAGAYRIMPRGCLFPRPRKVRVVFGDPLTEDELREGLQRGNEERLVELVTSRIDECAREAREWLASNR
ncbi:1-acyl-sn-glycerol-3-phosphate acyltransferase [Maioricimonas rarisocia]|uniref:1-acyl-sn-glycerol-3-phosphate acyltransferase n=1 Tax=Maioricimonas rarisocia TaxID=2528026 RepID=A0A517Z754_9PLAN|nr:lysophospholipid acyltransferase family protein [Maioricimonas rarisocia]QDU38318.1 1-acyl-sn-glycerol-3-phosphate acyltransferase [Maioricimonas rarisocia]